MTRCRNCGVAVAECELDHQPSDLCRGWRHLYADDPALYHSIVCSGFSLDDESGWYLAEPEDEPPWRGYALALLVGLLVLVVTVALAVAVTR